MNSSLTVSRFTFFYLLLLAPDMIVGQPIYELRPGRSYQASSYDTTGGNNDRINILPGQTAVIFNEAGPAIIERIWLTIDSRDPFFLRRIVMRIFWDEEKSPSVEVPVGDFFGCGYEYRHHMSTNVGMSSGGYYAYFPMPFRRKARIEIVNETGREVYAFYYHIGYRRLQQNLKQDVLYFHARWNRESRTDSNRPYTVLKASGKGQFVGLSLSGQSHSGNLGFLEGDERIFVDDERKPSIHGTGTEDYFSGGWYFKDGEFDGPVHGVVLLDDKVGRVTAYRHHIPDPITFQKSIWVTFEHGHDNLDLADMSSVAYWYQEEPHSEQAPLARPGQRIPLRRALPPRVQGPEAFTVVKGKSEMMDMSDHGADWIGNRQLRIDLRESDALVRIDGLSEDFYDVELFGTAGPGLESYQVAQNSVTVQVADLASGGDFLPLPPKKLENVKVSNGSVTLVVSGNGVAGIDGVRVTPVRHFLTDWYLLGPFPDPRESDYKRYGLDAEHEPEKKIDLNQSYNGIRGMISWQRYRGGQAGYAMGLKNYFVPNEMIVSYALTYVYSPAEQKVPLLIGTDDAAKVFLNGKEVYRFFDTYRIAEPDQDQVILSLKEGWNSLLLKLENNFGGYAFYARFPTREYRLVVNADQDR